MHKIHAYTYTFVWYVLNASGQVQCERRASAYDSHIQTKTYAYRYIHICLHIHNYAVCCFVHTLVCAYPLSGKYSFTVSLYVIFTFFTFLNFLTFFNLLTFIFNFNICCFYLTVAFVRLAHTVAALFCYAYACATVSSSFASSFTCTCMPYLCVCVCVRFVGFIFSARTMRRRKWSKCMYIVARFKCANSKRQHMKRKATTTTTTTTTIGATAECIATLWRRQ